MSWFPRDAKLLSKLHGRNGVEHQYECPICLKRNLWWNVDTQLGQCFSCNVGYNERSLRKLFKDESDVAELWHEFDEVRPIRPPREIIQSPLDEHWQARWFLEEKRGCAREDLEKVGVWYDAAADKVSFPLQLATPPDWSGVAKLDGSDIPAHISRSTDPGTRGWIYAGTGGKTEYWFNPLHHDPRRRTVVIVEGIFDVLTPRLLHCAIAILGTNLTEFHEFALRGAKRVVVWMDPDDAGRKASRVIARQLKNCVVVTYDKEPGDCSPQEARKVIYDAIKA